MSENNPVERENMKRKANEIDAVLNENNAKKRYELDDPEVNAQDIDVLPINSLAGLPEDLLRLIIPELGLKDRSSIACTCKRLYDLEAIVGHSLVLETWRGLISFEPNRIRLGFGMSMCLPLDSINMDGIVSVLQRILRTMDKKCNLLLDINFDMNNPAFIAILKFASEFSPRQIAFQHAGQTSRAIFTSEIIEALPWNLTIDIDLKEIVVSTSDMRLLYEKARDSSLNTIKFTLPTFSTRGFGEHVFGIGGFSFAQSAKLSLKTSLLREEIYATDYKNHIFYMKDGHRITSITRRAGDNLDVFIRTCVPYWNPSVSDRRIPTVGSSV